MGYLFIQLAVTAMLAVVFLQSGIDKVLDRRGNMEWLTGHFADSPLASMVPLLFFVITLVELAAGVLCGLGVLSMLYNGNRVAAFAGATLSTVAVVMLFFGQRLAKDYEGAAVLVNYFLLCAIALHVLT